MYHRLPTCIYTFVSDHVLTPLLLYRSTYRTSIHELILHSFITPPNMHCISLQLHFRYIVAGFNYSRTSSLHSPIRIIRPLVRLSRFPLLIEEEHVKQIENESIGHHASWAEPRISAASGLRRTLRTTGEWKR